MSQVLLVLRAAPGSGLRAREALDAALLFSAFVPSLSLLFSGDGCWQLLRDQQADAIGATPVAPVLAALAEYDINAVYVDAAALTARGIAAGELAIAAEPLDDDGIRALIAGHDRVLTF